MPYRIYSQYNDADTMRDIGTTYTEEMCYKNNIEDALAFVNDYIQKYFFDKNTKIHHIKGTNDYQVSNSCSYGRTIYIDEIHID